jgi:hypothetical protein
MKIFWKPLAAALLTLVIGVGAAAAQTCDAMAAPLEALAAQCAEMPRGSLCHDGQTIALDGVGGFRVNTLALGSTQANYPDVDAAQFVSLAFVGQLQVQPVVDISLAALPQRVPVDVVIKTGKVNVRAVAGRVGAAVAQLDNGTELNATGISRDSTWIRVELPDQPGQPAWISRGLLQTDYDIKKLPVVASADPIPQYPRYTPMQAFSFTSGSPCAGIVAQSGDNLAQLQVNGVALELHNATLFLRNPGDALSIDVLGGVVQVQAQDATTISVAGARVRVPLDASGQPGAAPDQPVAYDESAVAGLNGSYLQRAVSAAPPANNDAVQAALVTPLSGLWKIVYPPPYEYPATEGPQCEKFRVKGADHIFDISVADDGSSFSAFNPDITIGAGVRVRPGLYEMKGFSFQVLSPTEMTATYDTNALASCTSIITIHAYWQSPQR